MSAISRKKITMIISLLREKEWKSPRIRFLIWIKVTVKLRLFPVLFGCLFGFFVSTQTHNNQMAMLSMTFLSQTKQNKNAIQMLFDLLTDKKNSKSRFSFSNLIMLIFCFHLAFARKNAFLMRVAQVGDKKRASDNEIRDKVKRQIEFFNFLYLLCKATDNC